jgi:tryptophanyl-tRNA synthetase
MENNSLPRILTGHRPTGPRHIGHLVGTLKTWARLQDAYQCLFLVADIHVLTTDFKHPELIEQNTLEMVFDWLAAGIDPSRSILILQSGIPEHAQLCTLLGMLVSVARLERVPTYKEQTRELHLTPSLGLLSYPVLQAADILIYCAQAVPVGDDQLPHIELTKELARRFNQLYGNFFPEPEPILSNCPRLPGIDNRTMHTSYGNAIYLCDSPEETTRKVMSMYTDPTRIHPTDPGHIENNPVFTYLDEFDTDPGRVEELKQFYRAGKVGDVEVKRYLATVLNASLENHRQVRKEIASQKEKVKEIIFEGTFQARKIAQQTMKTVMEKMGLKTNFLLSQVSNQSGSL